MIRSRHSETFKAFHQAILDRKQIICSYKGVYREICPHILGHTKGVEKALVFQFAGESTNRLPPGGQWRCFNLSEIEDVKVREATGIAEATTAARKYA